MHSLNEYPEFFARFYDLIYDNIRSGDDHDYFMQLIKSIDGPVLEVGVGTGRFFTEALKNGADIYGIDVSPAMVRVLKQKINPANQQRVSIQDITSFSLNQRFDLLIAPFRVFMHLLKTEEQLAALENVKAHLNPGGRFVFDLFVPNVELLSQGLKDKLDFEGEYLPGKKVRRFTSMHADVVNQISHVTFKLQWEEELGVKEKTWHTSLRLFFRWELEHLLQLSCFDKYNIYGGFDEGQLNADSKEFLVICEK